MKRTYLMLMMLIAIGFIGCKSGNQGEATDTMALVEEDSVQEETAMSTMGGGMMGIMHDFMIQIESMKLTGDPDYDFAKAMQLHHRSGIGIAEDLIKNGSDTTTINLATRIKEDQEKDLQQLQSFLSKSTPGAANQEFIEDMKKATAKAKKEMDENMKMSGNFDRDFANMMVMHHNHGEDILKAEIKHGKNEEMKSLAKKMIDQHDKERKQLRDLK